MTRGHRLAGHRHRHDRAGQHGLRRRDEHRRRLGDDDRRRRPRRRTARSASTSPITGGTNVLNVVAVSPDGAHRARACARSSSTSCPGTLLLDVADPTGDDNGPGNYAYPTVGQLPRRRLRHHRASRSIDAGADVVFRVQTRDLTPTFGSPLGAQLVDVYVHEPGAVDDLDRGVVRRSATTRSRPASRGAG